MNKRKLPSSLVTNEIKKLILETSYNLPKDVRDFIKLSREKTKDACEKELLDTIISNYEIAEKEKLALCQDTGVFTFFIEEGNIEIEGDDIYTLINKAVSEVYKNGNLRPSIIDDPINGYNTNDNTPVIIHLDKTSNDVLKIKLLVKGGGSENATGLKTMAPSDGFDGVKKYLLELIKEKGINACPPLIIGIAIGGTCEQALLNSKKALFRKIGERHKSEYYSKKEIELKEMLNETNIGVMGLGGKLTVMDLFIEPLPRHMATMVVAISVLCHSARRGELNL